MPAVLLRKFFLNGLFMSHASYKKAPLALAGTPGAEGDLGLSVEAEISEFG